MAEVPLDRSKNQTSDTGPRAAININNATNVLIGDDNAVSALGAYEEIDGCPENHTNKNTGLFCQNCGNARRNTSDCTHRRAERPPQTPRPYSTPDNSFRSRTYQLQRPNQKYATGSKVSKRKPNTAYRVLNYPPEDEEFDVNRIDDHIEDITKTSGMDRKKKEQYIAHDLLPKLEKSCEEWSNDGEASVVVAKLACAGICDTITTHALELLLQQVSRNKIGGQAGKLQQIEEIVRRSITSDFFIKQKPELQEKLVVVFSHLLILLLNEISKNNHFYFQSKSEELKGVVEKLESYRARSEPKKAMERNPQLKLALDVISEAVERISEGSSRGERHLEFLKEVHSALESTDDPTKITKQLKKYQKKHSNHSWFDVVFSIYHIHGQENISLLDKIKLMGCLIEGYKREKSILKLEKTRCREFLAAISVLFDIIVTHSGNENLSIKAMECLREWHKAADSYSISPIIKAELIRFISMTLFGRNTRAIAARYLRDSGLCERENVQDYCEKYLKWFYRFFSLEMKPYSSSDIANDIFFTRKVFFRGLPAVAKILKINVGEKGQQSLPEQFIKEAHYHYYLSFKQHPNLVQLLSFNTVDPPYHIITEYMAGETAQTYFKNCSENRYDPPQTFLVDICLCVAKGAKFLSDQGLVHRALTMRNILIGDGNCKITGMETVRPLSGTCNGSNANVDGKGAKRGEKIPVYESEEHDYPITHASPESIRDGKFSTASDVWGFGVLLWEIFTFGCPAYSTVIDAIGNCLRSNPALLRQYILEGKTLPRAECFREEIYSLMERCWMIDPTQRPSFDEIIQHLEKFYEFCKGNESAPATPPVMEIQASVAEYPLYINQEQIIYSEPIRQQQSSNNNTVRNSKEMKPGQQDYMPLTERHDNSYHFPNMENNPPGYGSSGAPFLLGKPPAPYKHPDLAFKERAEEYANSIDIENTKRQALRNRMQSLGKPVLPEVLQQNIAEEIRRRTAATEKNESEVSNDHGLETVEEEVSAEKTFSCKALGENTGEIDQGYYDDCLGSKTDDPDDIYDDVYNPPVYENLLCKDNEKQESLDSGFEWQVTEEYYSFLDEHIYESVVPKQ